MPAQVGRYRPSIIPLLSTEESFDCSERARARAFPGPIARMARLRREEEINGSFSVSRCAEIAAGFRIGPAQVRPDLVAVLVQFRRPPLH